MIFLGVDPDTTHMGVASLETFGEDLGLTVRLARVDEDRPVAERLVRMVGRPSALYDAIQECAENYCNHSVVAAVELQHSRPGDKRPNDMMMLATAAGIAICAVHGVMDLYSIMLTPTPSEWKGSIPKHVKHNRIVQAVGTLEMANALEDAGIRVPKDLGQFKKEFTGHASHVLDAVGLALWARHWWGDR